MPIRKPVKNKGGLAFTSLDECFVLGECGGHEMSRLITLMSKLNSMTSDGKQNFLYSLNTDSDNFFIKAITLILSSAIGATVKFEFKLFYPFGDAASLFAWHKECNIWQSWHYLSRSSCPSILSLLCQKLCDLLLLLSNK